MLRNSASISRLFLTQISKNAPRFFSSSKNTTLIIGGGPIGLSTAYHLALAASNSNITVLERDPTYTRASATLSAGGIRQQFSLKQNVQMSIYGRDFLRSAKDLLRVDDEEFDVQFQEKGYLFLASSEKGAEIMKRNNEIQVGEGADVKLLNSRELKDKFPWLNVDDILLGSYGGEFFRSERSWVPCWLHLTRDCSHIWQYNNNVSQKLEKDGLIHGYCLGASNANVKVWASIF